MYNIGNYIMYGKKGVCIVKDVGYPELPDIDSTRLYYTLSPVYAIETIYIPVDTSVFMRLAMTHDEAISFIQQIPAIENSMEVRFDLHDKELSEFYKSLIETHDCNDLIRLIIMVYLKTQKAIQNKKKIGHVEQGFMRDAEDILYGELAIALDISKKSVPEFIGNRYET
jgi:CarD family transcriptional regulator